jgi:hypothetical protein
MSFDFKGRAADEVLLSHLHQLTRYDHTFNGQDKGSCGVLFDLAVDQYNTNLRNKNLMIFADELLDEGVEFSQAECEHVSEGYTWVLLKVGDDKMTCDVHVPLNLKNYEYDDSEDHPLLNMHYALESISEKHSRCYNKNGDRIIKTGYVDLEETSFEPVIHYTEVKYADHNQNEISKEEYDNIVQATKNSQTDKINEDLRLKNEVSDSFDELSSPTKQVNDHQDSVRKSIKLPSINAFYEPIFMTMEKEETFEAQSPNKINSSMDESMNFSSRKSFHNHHDEDVMNVEHVFLAEPTGLLGSAKNCQHEDKTRILDIYAAMITKKQTAGLVLYTENIGECLVRAEKDIHYEAVLSVNETECYFSVVVNQTAGEFEFTEENDTALVRCEDLQ